MQGQVSHEPAARRPCMKVAGVRSCDKGSDLCAVVCVNAVRWREVQVRWPDTDRVRVLIDRELLALWQLQAVEAAEDLVRPHHLQLLGESLIGLRDELMCAQQHLATARHGSDPDYVAVVADHVCSLIRETTFLHRHASEQDREFEQARESFLSRRDRLLDRIDHLQRLLP